MSESKVIQGILKRRFFKISVLVLMLSVLSVLFSSVSFGVTYTEIVNNVRVQILSSSLVRLEERGPVGFEDRATYHILERNWPGTSVTRTVQGNYINLATANFTVKIPTSGNSLSGIIISNPGGTTIWSYSSLPGNTAFLPEPTNMPSAWAIADTPRLVPPPGGCIPQPPDNPYPATSGWDNSNNAPDMYVFLPNGSFTNLRSEYIKLTGRTSLPPLYAFGAWDSKYEAYSESTALQKIDTYRSLNYPLDMFVVDTDWRVGGSAGYDINTTLFPDMTRFINSAHSKNVKLMFNDHPQPVASALDPSETQFRYNGLTSLFNIGLDAWWFDRNWSVVLNSPTGLNKETWGMHVYKDVTQNYYPGQRPLIMANSDGIDSGIRNRAPDISSHRYSIQWTGDTNTDYASLTREVENMVYWGVYAPFAYTSTDLGGHFGNPADNTYVRWIEYGALSPVFRPHGSSGTTRVPWGYSDNLQRIWRDFVKMRYRLLPTLYAEARNNYDTGEPVFRRCDLDYPGYSDATRNDQYLLGKGILIDPVLSDTSYNAWIPPGLWIDAWTGDTITGPVIKSGNVALNRMPIYIKSGTIIPLAPDMDYTAQKPWDPITLDVFPSTSVTAAASLYEDDRTTNGYVSGQSRTTALSASANNSNMTVTVNIGAASGTYTGASDNRSWNIRLRRPAEWSGVYPSSVTVDGVNTSFRMRFKDCSAIPFAVDGGSPDSDVYEITVPSGSVTSARAIVITFGSTAPTGLKAEYYDNMDLTGIKMIRTDGTVNFNWDVGSPDPSIQGDTYSARWTGQIEPRYSETYTFHLTSDNGRRLWVNNQLIIDKWIDDCNVTYSGTIALTAGQKYDIKIEYFENTGLANILFEWQSTSQAREIVPQSRLFNDNSPLISGLTYELVNKNSGKVLDVNNASTQDGANVQQYYHNETNAQKWKVDSLGSGIYKLTAQCSGKVLDVYNAGTTNGTNVQQYTWNGSNAQRWAIESVGGGFFKLTAQCSGKALDVSEVSVLDGANVHQWEYVTGENQKWNLVLLP